MDAMEDTAETQSIESSASTTNKTLNEFVVEHVKGFTDPDAKVGDDNKPEPKESDSTVELDAKDPLGEKDEKAPDALEEEGEKEEKGEKEETEKEEEGEKDEKEKDDKEEKAAKDEKAEGEEGAEELPEGKPGTYERFQEVTRERGELKQKLDASQPVVENFNRIATFCQQNNIVPEQFEKALRIQALLNTNPAEALKELTPVIEALQGFVGNKLPEDLQKKVDDGKMEIDDAKEMARLRAQNNFKERVAKQNTEMAQKQAGERAIAEATKASVEWERTKMASDPDYKKKSRENAPDGLYEDVRDKFAALLNQTDSQGGFVNPVNTPQQLVALQERAYQMVKAKWTSRLTPKKPEIGKKRLSSNGAQMHKEERTIENAKTMGEAIKLRLAERGIST